MEIIGPIRQEILSGIRGAEMFSTIAAHLAAFRDIPITTEDYAAAAEFYNLCRSKGIQGSNTDYLICAVAVRNRLAIFTTDRDFARYREHLPITLHETEGFNPDAPAKRKGGGR